MCQTDPKQSLKHNEEVSGVVFVAKRRKPPGSTVLFVREEANNFINDIYESKVFEVIMHHGAKSL